MREFRAGRSLYPLLLWAAVASLGALALWHDGLGSPLRLAGFSALLVLGPGAALAYAWRCSRSRILIHPGDGLRFADGRTLPWSDVRAVRRQPGLFDRDDAPGVRASEGFLEDAPPNSGEAVLLALVLHVLWILAWFLFLPAFALLARGHGRVILTLRDGSERVLEDLDDDVGFVRLMKVALRGSSGRTARLEQELGLPAW